MAEKEKIENQEKKTLQMNNEKFIAENKILRNERDDLKKEENNLSIALKSVKKDLKDTHYRFEKKKEELEIKIKELTEFKIDKTSEEKDMKNKRKKIEKKLKMLEQKEAKIKVDRNNFERSKKEKVEEDVNDNLNPKPVVNHNLNPKPPNLCSSPSSRPSTTPPCTSFAPGLSFTPPVPPCTQLPPISSSSLETTSDLPNSEATCLEWDREALDKLLEKEKARRTAELGSFHS